MRVSREGRPLPKILHGHHEAIFDQLPGSVLANLRRPRSENALVWNLIYPLERTGLDLRELLALRPLWGTPRLEADSESVTPYYWGFDRQGRRLSRLDDTLDTIDGPGPQTEIDLLLVGRDDLVAVEAKRSGRLGRCARYDQGVCPAHHPAVAEQPGCRYWEEPSARFDHSLHFPEPARAEGAPPCHRHYQLARTLRVGETLAELLGLNLHLWLMTPRSHWRRLEGDWIAFSERIKDPGQWRRLRALAWEDVAGLRGQSSSSRWR